MLQKRYALGFFTFSCLKISVRSIVGWKRFAGMFAIDTPVFLFRLFCLELEQAFSLDANYDGFQSSQHSSGTSAAN